MSKTYGPPLPDKILKERRAVARWWRKLQRDGERAAAECPPLPEWYTKLAEAQELDRHPERCGGR